MKEHYELLNIGRDQTVPIIEAFILGLELLAIYEATMALRHLTATVPVLFQKL